MYERGGKNYGIEGDRKMRFSTLGFDDKEIDTLDATLEFEKIREIESEKDRDKENDITSTEMNDEIEDDIER